LIWQAGAHRLAACSHC